MANGFANFPEGVTSFGAPMVGGMFIPLPASRENSGKVWVVANDSRGDTATIGAAIAAAHNGDTILIAAGDYNEQVVAPANLNDITIIGMGSRPRSVRWKSANTTAEQLKIQGSHWVLRNLYFAGGTAAFCVRIVRTASAGDATHLLVQGCEFNGGCGHILSDGGSSNVQIRDNRFIEAVGGTVTHPGSIVELSTAQAIPTNWEIANNTFYNSTNFIWLTLSRSMVYGNIFQVTGENTTAAHVLDLTGPLPNTPLANIVTDNTYAGLAIAGITIGNGFDYGTTGNHNFGLRNHADDGEVDGNPV